ncbi:hypothetical protein NIES2111_59080 (plasmid) [Nostoc sp. NIES-2111]|nr:hypothetical protein NIES2111_59080 [Nostoc sp. NIES-2111]
MKLLPGLMLVATSLTLIGTAVNQQSANAAIIQYTFKIENDVFGGQGVFSFDDSTFNNDPISIAPVQFIKFNFNNTPDTIYTELDDLDYPLLGPVVFPTVAGKSPFGLSYLFQDKINPAITYEISGYDFTIGNETFSGAVSYSPIPEPVSLIGTVTVCSIGWLTSRKIKLAKKAA